MVARGVEALTTRRAGRTRCGGASDKEGVVARVGEGVGDEGGGRTRISQYSTVQKERLRNWVEVRCFWSLMPLNGVLENLMFIMTISISNYGEIMT